VSTDLKPATSYTRLDSEGSPYLQGSRCEVCQAVFLGDREHCGRCGARSQMKPVALAARGHLYNYTIVYRSYPGIKVPFISAIVDLEGGGTVKGNLLEAEPDPKTAALRHARANDFSRSAARQCGGCGLHRTLFCPRRRNAP